MGSEAGGLGSHMTDPSGVPFHLCDRHLGFTLKARQQFFNAQLNSVRSLFLKKFASRQYTKVSLPRPDKLIRHSRLGSRSRPQIREGHR